MTTQLAPPAAPCLLPNQLAMLPPGPTCKDLNILLDTIFDPEAALLASARKFGDPWSFRLFGPPMVITGHPEGVRDIVTADPSHFAPFAAELLGPVVGRGSILMKGGEAHRRDRRLLTPPFHGARMRAYGNIIQEVTLRAVRDWPGGRPFNILDKTQEISMEVILRAVFGLFEDDRAARYRTTLKKVVAATNPLILLFPALRRRFCGLGPFARFERASIEISELLHDELVRRRQAPSGEDILGLLLSARYDDGGSMPDQEIGEQLMTLLFAGHETTAIALAWALYVLLRNSDPRERLLDELRPLGRTPDPDALARLPYLEAVCHEILRLYPVTPVHVSRQLVRPLVLRGHHIPAGVSVAATGSVLHQREDLFPEPQRFLPERFLERTYSPFEFIPFGGGNRRCIGSAFALYEMKIVLGTLMARGGLELVPKLRAGSPLRTRRRNLTLGPESPILMIKREA